MQVYSIFSSINGEVNQSHQGSVCTFVRLAGCSVGCSYCDTQYAADHKAGKSMTVEEVYMEVMMMDNDNVTITGGEPFEQLAEVIELTHMLIRKSHKVSIETSGEVVFNRAEFVCCQTVSLVVDIKMEQLNGAKHYLNMGLTEKDFLKIVVGSRQDVDAALHIKETLQFKGCKAKFAFSIMEGTITAKDVIDRIRESNQSDIILNIQLHKMLDLKEDKGL